MSEMYQSVLYLKALSHLNSNYLEFCQKLVVNFVAVYKIPVVQKLYGCESSVSLYGRPQLPLHLSLYWYFYLLYIGGTHTHQVWAQLPLTSSPFDKNKFFGS